jgi:Arc/MetJ-type ribon-helix-helix transcriptional regulator
VGGGGRPGDHRHAGVLVLLSGDESDTSGRILGTTAAIAGASLLAAPGAVFDRMRAVPTTRGRASGGARPFRGGNGRGGDGCGDAGGMLSGMTRKIAISLPDELVEHARQAVASGRAASVSGYVAAALEERRQTEDLAAMLDEMLAESGGPMTGAERQRADRQLFG